MSTIFKKIGALLRFKMPKKETMADMSEMEHMSEHGQMLGMRQMSEMAQMPEPGQMSEMRTVKEMEPMSEPGQMTEEEHMPEPGQMKEMSPMKGMENRKERQPEEHGSNDMAAKPGKKKPDQM